MKRYLLLFIILILSSYPSTLSAYDWPVWPDSSVHRIGNSYGEYQGYGGSPYMHTGIDIMIPWGTPVYACKSGYVKAIMTLSASLHWRVIVGDSAGTEECNALMYAHLNEASIINFAGLSVGDYVEEGQYLGDIVYFIDIFHHIHFAQIRHSGDSTSWANGNAWDYSANPLDELDNIYDPDPPVFENAHQDSRFAICVNETNSYFDPGANISGNVDIVCKVYDYINHYDWKLTPYQIEYSIEGDSSIPWTNSLCFTTSLGTYADNYGITSAIYKSDNVCLSQGNYDDRNYYFIMTNTDNDSLIETSDKSYSWMTSFFHNGEYTIRARAKDRAGNTTETSMPITIANFSSLSGQITLEDTGDMSGTIVTVLSSGQTDTTNSIGDYEIHNISGGSQPVNIYNPGYATIDTTLMMNINQSLNAFLEFYFVCGDATGNNIVNILDVTYLISYLYKGGPPPVIFESADVNLSGTVNILDITYLINYLYKDGPDPTCP